MTTHVQIWRFTNHAAELSCGSCIGGLGDFGLGMELGQAGDGADNRSGHGESWIFSPCLANIKENVRGSVFLQGLIATSLIGNGK